MKRYLLSVLIPISLGAQQSYNVVIDAEQSTCDHLITLGPNYYYILKTWTEGFIDPVKIESRNSNGILRFSTGVTKDEATHITEMIAVSDHAVVLAGYVSGCDYPGMNPSHFIMKIDTAGNKLFDVNFAPYQKWNAKTLHLAELPDSSYVAAGDSMLYHFSNQGVLLSSKKMLFGDVSQVMTLPSGDLLVNAFHQSVWKHVVIDNSGNIISSLGGGPSARYGLTSSGSVVSLSAGQVELFGLSMTTVTTTSQLPAMVDLVVKNDSIYVISADHEYQVLNANLAPIHSYSLSSPVRKAKALAILAGRAAFLSDCSPDLGPGSNPYKIPGQSAAITFFPRDQGFSYSRDVGVIAVTCDSCAAILNYSATSNMTFIDYYASLRVTVKNYGPDVVTSFYLNDAHITPWICGFEYAKQQFTGLSVSPGATVQVLMQPRVIKSLGIVPGQSVPTMSGAVTFSLFTSAPDMQIDEVPGNDFGFSTVLYHITDVAQQEHEPALALYPNPFRDRLTFSGTERIESVRVFSAEGRIVHESFPGTSEGEIEVENLTAGFYVVQVQTGNRTLRRKITRH